MFDSLSIEKRRILLEYPFARAFAAEKLDFETFLDNINEFKPDLIKKGFTDSDFETLSIIKKVHDRQTDMKEGLEILKKYNFPIDQDKKFAYFLATHSEDLQSMAKAAGKNVVSMFQYGLPEINSMLEKEIITWPQIVNGLPEMANQSRENTDYMFNTDCMFKFGIPQFNRLLEKKIITWPQMVKDLPLMTKATGPNAWRLFFHGIPAIKNLITKENWPHIVELTKTSGHGTNDLFQYGLPVIKEILTEENWPHIIELTKAVGEDTAYLFQVGLIEIKDILTEENWPYIIKIAKATGKHTNYVFYHGLANVKHLIDESNLRNFVDFFVYVGISNQRIMKMMRIFNVLEPRTDPLLLYLIMFKPKLVLNILQKRHLLEQLQIDFDQELDLFLRIASPITLKEKNFAALAKITRPLKDIPAQAKNNFLKFLDLSIHTFQDVNVSFVKSLQETDFRNIDDFSFVELVYIYLKFAENPELKINNLKKSLKKLKKEENKCLKLINDKISYENLNSMEKKKLSATLQKISEMFFDSVLTLYSETAKDRIKYSLENTFKIKIKNISKKTDNESFFNALCILKTLEEDKHPNYPHCFNLIKHYLEDKTYPLKREILNCYPWTLPQNKDWCKNHLSNKEWLKDFRKEYVVTSKDKEKTNVEERIKHHLEQAQKIITELHLEIKGLNLNNIEELYKKLAKEKTKYPGSLISDLKTQISAIKSLQGEKKAGKISVGKIIIQPEFDPLEILQMGNYVSGSCLATNGANYWSTVTNAIEVNKRILWAKDSKGKIIARILIAVDKNNNILKFPIYYEITTNLNKYFDEYLVELAKKCGFGLKGNKDNVEELITDEWYSDSEIEIELDHL